MTDEKKERKDFLQEWNSLKKKRHRQLKKVARVLGIIIKNPRGILGIIIIGMLLVCAIFAPWIAPYDPYKQDIINRITGPSLEHLLGTDNVGRDILSRIIYGARIAAIVSIGGVIIAAMTGILLGTIAGYIGGVIENGILWIVDVIRAFPQIILILVLVAVLGPSIPNMITVLALTSIPQYTRVARAETLSAKEEGYVFAAKSLGAKNKRILLKHIIPNILPPIIILAGMDMAVMIMWEGGLSFLGLGVRPPAASWGVMLKNGYKYILSSPWMIIWSSIALATAMLGYSLFAESLRVALNPKESMERQAKA